MPEPLQPGDLVVVRTSGYFLPWAIRVMTFSRYNHVICYVGLVDGVPTVIEAKPEGVVKSPLSDYDGCERVETHFPLSDHQRSAAVFYWFDQANKKTKYGWFDIAALAITRVGIRPKWLVRRAEDDSRMVCSQLAAYGYDVAGYQFFSPPRNPWFISPGDLALAYDRYLESL